MRFPGEKEALQRAKAMAETYGYGNLIAYLKREWALKLMAGNDRLDYKGACLATDVPAYPKGFDMLDESEEKC